MKPITDDRLLFDLHCDTLTECHKRGIGLCSKHMPHFSLDRLPDGLRLCQAMAVFMPDHLRGVDAEAYFDQVYQVYLAQAAQHSSRITPVTDTARVGEALNSTRFASILTVEGGSALGGKLENVQRLYDLGVRMLTLTWNGANELAGGAATTQGFTPLGRQVVTQMERLGMAVDVSHLSDASFWELCDFAAKPFAASHSNARAVCGNRRNLTDDMFREIVRRGGVVGLNYYVNFIAEDSGQANIDGIVRHAHHFLELGGEDTLALGSDFDGADVPEELGGLDKLPSLLHALDCSGIPPQVVEKILFHNANRYFTQVIGGCDK